MDEEMSRRIIKPSILRRDGALSFKFKGKGTHVANALI